MKYNEDSWEVYMTGKLICEKKNNCWKITEDENYKIGTILEIVLTCHENKLIIFYAKENLAKLYVK